MAGKTVLITGANRGLGLEFVLQFLKLTPPARHIIAVCRAPDQATELKKIAASNPSVHLLGMEITEPAQHDKAVEAVKKIVGPSGLNILIHNAGIMDKSIVSLEQQTKENLMQHLDLNTVTPVLLTKAFLPLLKQAAGQSKPGDFTASSVIMISAILGSTQYASHFPGAYPYKYSKSALNMATYCLAEDLKKSNIFVMALHPGWVRTDLGGPAGELSVEESAGGCTRVIVSLEEKHRGKMFDWKGGELPY